MPPVLPYICDLNPYQPGLPIELVTRKYGIAANDVLKLASNENPLGPSPKALHALRAAANDVHRYPEQYELVQALSKHLEVKPGSIVLGNGSNDILDLIARTYVATGWEAISSKYAFAIYQIATQSTGAKNVVVPAKQYGHDLQAMLVAITPRTKIIWVANPNNPTGTFVPYAEIKTFLNDVPKDIVVVLDEAYYEYLDPEERVDSTKWLKDFPNLILVRTFSKIYGLAGLRIGYGITSPEIAELLNRVRQPFNVNGLALAAAKAALADKNFIARSYQTNKAGLKQLKKAFDQLDLEYLTTYGNFITVKVKKAQELNESLLRSGIIVRHLASYHMPDHLRITIGNSSENQQLLSHLQRYLPD